MAILGTKDQSVFNGLGDILPGGALDFEDRTINAIHSTTAGTPLSGFSKSGKALPMPKDEPEVAKSKLVNQFTEQAKGKDSSNNAADMLFWAEMFKQHATDESGISKGNVIADIIKLGDALGFDTSAGKQFIAQATGKPYSEFAKNSSSYNFDLGRMDDVSNFSHSNNGSLRDRVNETVLQKFARMDHLSYGMGSRTGSNGRIDCSGFISQLANAVDRDLNGRSTKLSSTLNSTSEGQYINAKRMIGGTDRIDKSTLMNMEANGTLQAGMVISTDKGATRSGFDANRKYGIDHVVMTAERNGQLVIVESRSGAGVTMTDFDDWIKSKGNTTFFVTDMVKLAQATSPNIQMASQGPSPNLG